MLAAACCLGPGCASSEQTGPTQTFAESSVAQREYRNLRARWFAARSGERGALEPEIRRFVARHFTDDRARSASIFLAWIRIDQNDLGQARTLVDGARKGKRSGDYLTVTEAAIATRAGDPERALALLEPLAGKIVDPDERLVYGEERVRAALSARRFEHSVHAMLDWLVQAPADRYEAVRRDVAALLSRVPTHDGQRALEVLGGAIQRDSGSPDVTAVRRWLSKTLFAELARRALEASDGALARALLPHAPPSLRTSAEYAALARQAAHGSATPRIAGRAVGLFLSVGTDEGRRRSASLAAGVSRALEAARPRVELVVRDDAGAPERGTATLAALAGDGAAILIAGVDPESAAQAAVFAERARIPLLLVQHTPSTEPRRHAFVLSPDPVEVTAALESGLVERGRRKLARVGEGGVSCDTGPAFAGQPRFPLDDWRKQRVDGVVVLGPASCARDVVREVRAAGLPLLVACGLECAESALARGGPALAVRAGTFPAGERAPGRDWYEALGRDAAALAAAALADFPEERVVDPAQVGELHARARSALERVEVSLETSDFRGFAGGHVLPRTLGVVDGALANNDKNPKP